MARNAEKAMTTLARWRQAQLDSEKTPTERRRRPFLASDCDDLADAEKFRLDIIREVSRKVTQIQNAGLGEHRIRDLNDQINKLLREKRHWEYRIGELGGTVAKSIQPSDFEGKEVPGSRGYRYFGAAKDLPGVRELFAQSAPPPPRKTRAELMINVDASYYGYGDEDDGVILPLEVEAERKARAAALGKDVDVNMESETHLQSVTGCDDDGVDFVGPRRFVSYVPNVPSLAEVQAELLARRKAQLLKEYAS